MGIFLLNSCLSHLGTSDCTLTEEGNASLNLTQNSGDAHMTSQSTTTTTTKEQLAVRNRIYGEYKTKGFLSDSMKQQLTSVQS